MSKCKQHQLPAVYCQKCLMGFADAMFNAGKCETDAATVREYAATIRALQKMILAERRKVARDAAMGAYDRA